MSVATKIIKKIQKEKQDKLVSVIVPIFNKVEFTLQMLSYFFANTKLPCELIIVDNNSTDKSEEVIKEFFKQCPDHIQGQYIKNTKNNGFSIANNQAAKIAVGNLLCFLNNDTIPLENWLTELVSSHKRHKASVTGAKLISPGGIIQHAGIEFDRFNYPYHKYGSYNSDIKEVSEDKEYPAVTGACMLVNKDEFLKIGGFDEAYWLGWEDIDLCNRYKEAGKSIWYSSKSELYHYESMSDGRYSKETDNWYLYSKRWVFAQFNS